MNENGTVYAFDGFRLNVRRRTLFHANGDPVPLAPRVLDLLVYFVEHAGQRLNKRALLETVWPDVVVEENNLNQAVSALRRVLGEQPGDHRFIATEPGRGYRFVAAVNVLDEETEQPESRTRGPGAPTPARSRPHRYGQHWVVPLALGVLVAIIATFAYVQQADEALANSVAVLPFDDLSPDPDNAYISAGMHAEIISQLTKVRDLNVIGRDAVLLLAEDGPSYSQIASKLNVGSILVGTFRYADEQIRVNVQLVDPRTGANLWAADYQRGFSDVFGVQADIAMNVARHLNAELSTAERRRIERRPTASMEAYRAYWRAFNFRDFGTRVDALSSLERAIELDSEFALAYGHLALLYARSLIDWGTEPAVPIEPEELQRRVLTSAQRALELDPDLALAHVALGEMNMHYWRWAEAESAFAAAYELNPNDPTVLGHYSQFNTFRGEYSAAIVLAERLLELDPPLPEAQARGTGSLYFLWLAHVYSGNVPAALDALNEHLRLHPRQVAARFNLAFVEARRGNREAAKDAFRIAEEATAGARSATMTANLAYGYSRIGETDRAVALFEDVQDMAERQAVGAGTWAIGYLAIGDDRSAVEWLDRALESIDTHAPAAGWFSLMILKHDLTGDAVLAQAPYAQRLERIRGL